MAYRPEPRNRSVEGPEALNLAPIMNVVMILIPLLLVSASFMLVATLEVHSPAGHPVTGEPVPPEEEVPVPRVLVAITADGFTITDLGSSAVFVESGLGDTLDCGDTGSATICNATPEAARLLDRLDYRALYNRLMAIRQHEAWSGRWEHANSIINLVADRDVPAEVVIRTMDVARYMLVEDSYASHEAFRLARWRTSHRGEPVALFENPMLLLPRAVVSAR